MAGGEFPSLASNSTMAGAWPNLDASLSPRIKPERLSKESRSAVNGKRVIREAARRSDSSDGESGEEQHSQSIKIKPEKKPAKNTFSDDEEEEEEEPEPKSRKRMKVDNGRPRRSGASIGDSDDDEEVEEVQPAVKIFVRDPKDG